MKKFDEVFRETLEDIERRAKALGRRSMSGVFEKAGFSCANLYRWNAKVPRTIRMVVQLQEEIERLEAEMEKGQRDD